MIKKNCLVILGLLTSSLLTGCVNVAVQDSSSENYAKEFNAPPSGWSGLYLYRTCNIMGTFLKKSLYVDGQYIGETSRCRFFFRLVKPGIHELQTESEFSENSLSLNFVEGKNYYVKQYLKPGFFVGGANLEEINTEEAQKDIKSYKLAENKDNPKLNLKTFQDDPNKGSIPGPKNAMEAQSLAK
ncbi:MAG: DUF2846 domain-containing protein [Succinivibrionaceae bacterium]